MASLSLALNQYFVEMQFTAIEVFNSKALPRDWNICPFVLTQ